MPELNYWAVLVSAVATMPIGMIWYNPKVFGAEWMKLSGIKADSPEQQAEMKKKEKPAMAGSFVLALVMAFVLAGFIDAGSITSVGGGLRMAGMIWLGFVGTTSLTNALFSNTPKKLWAIQSGYWLAVLLVMGAILAGWSA